MEAEAGFVERLAHPADAERVRVWEPISTAARAAANGTGVAVIDAPVLANGRLELRWYLREQTVSHVLHRYGNVSEPRPARPRHREAGSSRSRSRRLTGAMTALIVVIAANVVVSLFGLFFRAHSEKFLFISAPVARGENRSGCCLLISRTPARASLPSTCLALSRRASPGDFHCLPLLPVPIPGLILLGCAVTSRSF